MPNRWAYPPAHIITQVSRYQPGAYDRVWRALQAAAQYPGAELTSWYRDPARNARVGGALTSQHQLGLALDLYAANLGELAAHMRAAVPEGRVILEERPPHVHFQALPSLSAAARGLAALLPGGALARQARR